MLGQKEAVIKEVLAQLPTFQKGVDNALVKLSSPQLEAVKAAIYSGIAGGQIEYSKDKSNLSEVRSYARSMVMNHLKKAKELNGGVSSASARSAGGTNGPVVKPKLAPKGINPDLLTDELKEFVKTLV